MSTRYYVIALVALAVVFIVLFVAYRRMGRS